MSNRAKAAAALASLGVLGIGWGTATASGQTLALNPTYDTASTDTTSTDTASTTTTDSTASGESSSSTSTSTPTADTSSSTTADTTSAASGLADGTYTGATATHRYGSVTVTVTISGGVITDVSEQVVSDGDRKSDSINSRSVPVMRSEVLAANSADVSTVSGATYTTRAYLSSLQPALDQAAS